MNKIKNILTNASTKLMMHQVGVKTHLSKERGDHLLEVLGTIIIAVVLLVIFRGQLTNIFNNAMGTTSNKITNLFN